MKKTARLALSFCAFALSACIVQTGPTMSGSASRSPVPQVALGDMHGMKAGYLDSDMNERGFRNTGGYQSEGAAHTTWWNEATRQCVSITTRDGRVDSIESIAEGNCR